MRNSIQRRRVTFTDGIGPDGAGKGTVLLMPFSWVSERVSAEILAFAEKTLGVTSGETYMYPAVTSMTSNASVYTNDGMVAALVSFMLDSTDPIDCSASYSGKLEVLSIPKTATGELTA